MAAARRVPVSVSLVDIMPTLCDLFDLPVPEEAHGVSLLPEISGTAIPGVRGPAFSEYHGHGCARAVYMLRYGRWKYVHYVSLSPQLFDLAASPNEETDLAPGAETDPEIKKTIDHLQLRLRRICHPDKTDARARHNQRKRRKRLNAIRQKRNSNAHPDQ